MVPRPSKSQTNGKIETESPGELVLLLPYFLGLMAVTGFQPARLLFPLGVALIATRFLFNKQVMVQPMKLVASIAIGTAAVQHGIHPETVSTAALLTGLIWLLIAAFGLGKTISTWVPSETVTGLNIGVGLYLMLTALQMMWDTPYWSALLFLGTSLLLKRRPMATMLLVTIIGLVMNLHENSTAMATVHEIKVDWLMPTFQVPMIDGLSLWIALTFLVLPQLVLTLGHNGVFAEDTQHKLAFSTGILNMVAGLFGGAPLAHNARGEHSNNSTNARGSHAPVAIGLTLVFMACLFSDAIRVLVERLPDSALGVLVFFAGLQLILGTMQAAQHNLNTIFLVITVLVFLWNAGLAVLLGLVYHWTFQTKNTG